MIWYSPSIRISKPPLVASKVWSQSGIVANVYEIVMFLLKMQVKVIPMAAPGRRIKPSTQEFKIIKAFDYFPFSTLHMLSLGIKLMSGFGIKCSEIVLVSLFPTIVDAGEKHYLNDFYSNIKINIIIIIAE
ncbi:Hypothetical_protein [Hexamita inflata]|uniref:Hypothetical_protein n=1 Tax=Hexamita inflata TaxID=28002 RepID=A0AA86TD44_9EUKA|nr:Hypothetical protein HINF_LOCUS1921 [Hexamita inflata]CAI9934696.1 Hypothetical protein HINF_LOCUS22341 [Hexamita inflata]